MQDRLAKYFEAYKSAKYQTTSTRRPLERAYEGLKGRLMVPESGIVLGEHPDTAETVWMDAADLAVHLHVIGPSGRGKSYLLRALIDQLLERREKTGEGICVVDPHGSLATYLLDQCVLRNSPRPEEVVYLDLKPRGAVPVLNPLRSDVSASYGAHSFVEAIGKVFGSSKTTEQPLTTQVLLRISQVLIESRLTVAESVFFTENTEVNHSVRRLLLGRMRGGPVRDFWEKVAGLPAREQDAYCAPACRRFAALLEAPTLRRIVAQTRPGIDFGKLMDEGAVVICNLAREGTDITAEGQQLLGTLLLQDIRASTERREPDGARPFHLIVDEFAQFLTPDALDLLTGGRKFGVHTVLAHQDLEQLRLPDGDRRLISGVLAIQNKAVFGGGVVADSALLAEQLFVDYLDADERKLELWSRGFKPVPQLVTNRSWATSQSEGRSGGWSRTGGIARSSDESRAETETESRSAGSQGGWTAGVTETETESEAWATSHEEFRQLSSVQFRGIPELIYRRMQELHRQPVGHCTIVVRGQRPQPCLVPDMSYTRPPEALREAFLARVFERPEYVRVDVADRSVEERAGALLEEVRRGRVRDDQEPEIWVGAGG